MLQFITHESDKYSIAEEVQMAIEGGCRWIQLRMKDATDEEVRNVALELIPMCRETDTFLIIDDRVAVVNDLKVSGVHLGKEDMDPMEARATCHYRRHCQHCRRYYKIQGQGSGLRGARSFQVHYYQKESRSTIGHRWLSRHCPKSP